MIERRTLRQSDSPSGAERRTMPRRDAKQLGPVTARVIGGEQVKLLDFSRRGVLIESTDRLSIGARATLRIVTVDASISIHGRVVRSKVVKTSIAGLVYHTALELDEDLGTLEAAAQERRDVWQDGHPADTIRVPAKPVVTMPPSVKPSATDAAPTVASALTAPDLSASTDDLGLPDLDLSDLHYPARPLSVGSERASSDEAAGVDDTNDFVLEFMTTVPHDLEELRRRAAVNNW
jgi:hypothetical protein